jgi:hypothetical protein
MGWGNMNHVFRIGYFFTPKRMRPREDEFDMIQGRGVKL